MKQVLQNFKTGELIVADVTPPVAKPGLIGLEIRLSRVAE